MRSKGSSWCAYACRVVWRVARASSAKPGSPPVLMRSGRVLTKKPMSSLKAGWSRPETEVPTTMSSWPVQRRRVAAKPASIVM